MKQFNFFILLFVLFGGCKKKDLTGTDFHLVRISSNSGSGDHITWFDYDASGRLKKRSDNGQAAFTDISYTGNQVLIKRPVNAGFNEQNEIRYQLDTLNRPVQRNSFLTELYPANSSNFGPEYHNTSEVTNYEYAADGTPLRCTGILKDSISYWPMIGIFEIHKTTVTYSAAYEIVGTNLKSITRTLQAEAAVTAPAGSSFTSRQSAEEKIIFSYDKVYPNRFDFKNSFLLKELGVLPFPTYPISPNFSNFPNKATTTRVVKNVNGAIVSTENLTEETALEFNVYSYILTKRPNLQLPKEYFFYSRF